MAIPIAFVHYDAGADLFAALPELLVYLFLGRLLAENRSLADTSFHRLHHHVGAVSDVVREHRHPDIFVDHDKVDLFASFKRRILATWEWECSEMS